MLYSLTLGKAVYQKNMAMLDPQGFAKNPWDHSY
jgi:hypothetical protein